MRVLAIPDSHLKIDVIERGLELAKYYRCDKIVLLGDYFDDWDAVPEQYHRMIDYLRKLLRLNPEVYPLLGNHEYGYFNPQTKSSGYREYVAEELRDLFANNFRFAVSASFDGVLYTHAGVTNMWLLQNKLITERQLQYNVGKKAGAGYIDNIIGRKDFGVDRNLGVRDWDVLAKVGAARGGLSGVAPSPIWADATEVIADPLRCVKQVVGHSPVSEITNVGRVWFTDTYSNGNISDEYLVVNNGFPVIVHYGDIEDGIRRVKFREDAEDQYSIGR